MATQPEFKSPYNDRLFAGGSMVQHILPHLLRPYFERLNEVVEGYLFFTIPVERGVIFFFGER